MEHNPKTEAGPKTEADPKSEANSKRKLTAKMKPIPIVTQTLAMRPTPNPKDEDGQKSEVG